MTEAFSVDEFLAFFPEFDSKSRAVVQAGGLKAGMHIGKFVDGMPMPPRKREYALFLMTAHLLELDDRDADVADGGQALSGTAFKATIGSVQIENTKPNSFSSDDWTYWLNQTKHGRELLAFLDVQAPIGVNINSNRDSVRDLV